MTIYTIGHSTRPWDEFLALLRSARVEAVADVRAFPSSRRHPQFNGGALKESLAASGIGYVHFPQLGGRREPRADSINGAWRERAFRGYADHMASTEFAAGLRRLIELGTAKTTTIMCAEAVWWRCHRRLIADALTVTGWRVEHLGVGGRSAEHELPAFAVVDGGVTYPPAQTSLLD